MRWSPVPRELVEQLRHVQWTPEMPAPEAVVWSILWAGLDDGRAWTRREVANYAGWGDKKARRVLEEVASQHAAWSGGGALAKKAKGHERPTRAPPAPHPIGSSSETEERDAPPAPHPRPDRARDLLSTGTDLLQGSLSRASQEPCQDRPAWVPPTAPQVDPEIIEASVVTCVQEVRQRLDRSERAGPDGRVVLTLWEALDFPPLTAFVNDVALVARACRECPDPLFARDVRAEGWDGGADRSTSVRSVLKAEAWPDRLDAARAWRDRGFPAEAAPQARGSPRRRAVGGSLSDWDEIGGDDGE